MKIAVNTRLLLPHKLEGIGWFSFEILKRLTRQHQDVEWLFLFDRAYDPDFIFNSNVTPIVVPPQSRHPVLWYLWFEWGLPPVFKKHRPDLFLSTDGYLSLSSNVKSLPVIHDINFEHDSSYIPWMAAQYLRYYFPKFARHGHRVATVSEYSRQDIASTYGISESKIDLVYNGCGDFFHPLPDLEKKKVQEEVSGGAPYFIFVGALNPRKNITGMLQAYSIYRKQGGSHKFVIVGEKMFWNRDIQEIYEEHPFKDDVIFTGRLEGKGLNRVLASSVALLFVSHFEGFGIPIVEAFKCEVPVITATTTSMPEVAGEAALFCDPENYQQIAEAMHKVGEPLVKDRLIALGKERSELFTWERSAEMMWASIEKTLGQ